MGASLKNHLAIVCGSLLLLCYRVDCSIARNNRNVHALYVKNEVADVHGISIYGKISDITFVRVRQNEESAKFEVD